MLVVSAPGEAAVRWARRHAHGDWGIEVLVCSVAFTDPSSARDRAGRILAGCPAASRAVRPVEGTVEDGLRQSRPADLVVIGGSVDDRLRHVLREAGHALMLVPSSEAEPGPWTLSGSRSPGLHGRREDLRGPPAGPPG